MSLKDDFDPAREPVGAWCDMDNLHVMLRDGRRIVTPLWWYPRLLQASPVQRNNVELMLSGVHWPDVDEDLSVRGMLLGLKAVGAVAPDAIVNEAA